MLSELQKRRIEEMYSKYYELAYNEETSEDMKVFYMGKYLAIDEMLRSLGYSLKMTYKIE